VPPRCPGAAGHELVALCESSRTAAGGEAFRLSSISCQSTRPGARPAGVSPPAQSAGGQEPARFNWLPGADISVWWLRPDLLQPCLERAAPGLLNGQRLACCRAARGACADSVSLPGRRTRTQALASPWPWKARHRAVLLEKRLTIGLLENAQQLALRLSSSRELAGCGPCP